MKHQSYIRSLFVAFFACFAVSTMAGDLNPFAFKLSSELVGDVFNVNYYLNAPATSVKVTITLPNDQKVVYDCTDSLNTQGHPRVKGIYQLKISLREKINDVAAFRDKENLRWYVDVTGGNTATWPAKGKGAVLAAKEITKNYNFYNAGSIDIDINPYSENFGLVYVLERRKSTTAEDYFSTKDKNTKPGIYVFDPAFQSMPVTRGKYDFVTGTDYTDAQLAYSFNATNYNTINGYYDIANLLMSARIAYDDDNETRLFVSCQTQSGPILMYGSAYYLNCTRGAISSNWYHYVISGSRASDYSLKSGSDFVAAPNIAFDIQGNKAYRKAMMFSAAGENLVSGDDELERENYRCDEYSLANYNYVLNTTSSPHNCKPTLTGVVDLYNKNGVLQPNSWYMNSWSPKMQSSSKLIGFNVQLDLLGLEYDADGNGFWLCQTRDHHSGMPSLTHFKYNSSTKKYEVNFIEYWANRGRSAVRYDINHERLAVSGGKYYIKESESGYSDSKFPVNSVTKSWNTYYKHPAATPCYATIYTVNKDELYNNFVTNLTNEQTKSGTTVISRAIFSDSAYVDLNGCKAADFAWDYADNLYVAMGADHKVTAFALPNGGKPVSTPCKDAYRFNTNASQLTVNIYPQNVNCGTVVDYEFQKSFAWYMNGATFKLEAKPNPGYRFVSWLRYNSQHDLVLANARTMAAGGLTMSADFGINVHEDTRIVDINADTDFKAVYVKRDLDTESYSTICLPFNLETLEGTPYEGASVLEFSNATPSQENGDNRIFLEFSEVEFATGKGMRAGQPYLIKVANPVIGEKMFWNVTCPDIDNQGQSSQEYAGVTFKGILNPTTFEASETNLFLVADDRLAVLTKGGTINGLRAYFIVPEGTKAENVSINVVNKVPTATPNISLLDSIQPTKYMWNGQIYIQRGNDVYNLSGAKVK